MKTAILNTQAPFASQSARDSLDLAMTLATYEQELSLFFKGEAVLQLLKSQKSLEIGRKDFTKTFKALPLYDIEQVYLDESALKEYNLSLADLSIEPTLLNSSAFYAMLNTHSTVFTF